MIRTNIMLTPQQHQILKRQATSSHRTLGELVREAIDNAFGSRDVVECRKKTAIDAYREGFISLGKLAEALGIDPVSTRQYLRERKIQILSQEEVDIRSDAANA
jgi:predicted HTH domain antitoxin